MSQMVLLILTRGFTAWARFAKNNTPAPSPIDALLSPLFSVIVTKLADARDVSYGDDLRGFAAHIDNVQPHMRP